MRTEVVLPGVVSPDGLQVQRRPLAEPGPGEVLIEVEATGVSFAEQQMRRGRYFDQPPFPFVPGYDLVGVVRTPGPLFGQRVAALTKVGAWASHVVLPAADLVPVPSGVSAVDAEALVVNGVTAWQMLHRTARVQPGSTVLVHGATGGVGSVLVRLALSNGVRVIGTASARHHAALRALGVAPIDYRSADVPAQVRALAPEGVDAVFDHVGGRSVVDSWRLLARGGTLVAYGSASTKDSTGNKALPVLKILARTLVWNLLPNGRRAAFFNVWAGHRRISSFRARLREDLGAVFAAVRDGVLTPVVAAEVPLARVADAVRLAESGTVAGKIVLVP